MKSREKKVKVGAAKKLSAYPSDGFVPNAAVTTSFEGNLKKKHITTIILQKMLSKLISTITLKSL
jgi:hypothetical protein